MRGEKRGEAEPATGVNELEKRLRPGDDLNSRGEGGSGFEKEEKKAS